MHARSPIRVIENASLKARRSTAEKDGKMTVLLLLWPRVGAGLCLFALSYIDVIPNPSSSLDIELSYSRTAGWILSNVYS